MLRLRAKPRAAARDLNTLAKRPHGSLLSKLKKTLNSRLVGATGHVGAVPSERMKLSLLKGYMQTAVTWQKAAPSLIESEMDDQGQHVSGQVKTAGSKTSKKQNSDVPRMLEHARHFHSVARNHTELAVNQKHRTCQRQWVELAQLMVNLFPGQ